MRMSRIYTCVMLIVLFVTVFHGGRLNAAPVIINFEQFDSLSLMGLPEAAPVPESARLCDQLLASYGLIFTSGAPYVAVLDYYRCIPSGPRFIGGVAPDGTLTWSSDYPVTITFRKPGDGSLPAVTDFVSIQGDLCGDGRPITLKAFDIDGNLIASDTDGDWGPVLTVSTPTRVIHQVKFFGHPDPYAEGVGWDNLTFNTPVPVNTPPVGVLDPASQRVEVGSVFTIRATAQDSDGDVLTYQLLKGNEVLASGIVDAPDDGSPIDVPPLVIGANDPRFGLGVHSVDLVLDDPANDPVTTTATVTVEDSTAPSLKPKSSENILWPPNHELRPVTITANASDSGGAVSLTASVASNEPQEDGGDGSTDQDWTTPVIDNEAGTIELSLRAERSGSEEGRVYTITITATDPAGNASVATVEVRVPHDRRKK